MSRHRNVDRRDVRWVSKARLVITAVVIEGRSQSEVARTYGISQGWISRLVKHGLYAPLTTPAHQSYPAPQHVPLQER